MITLSDIPPRAGAWVTPQMGALAAVLLTLSLRPAGLFGKRAAF